MRIFSTAMCALAAVLFVAVAAFAGGVAGKTVKYHNSYGQTYWTTYHANGTSSSKSTNTDGSCCMYDTGHWRDDKSGELCERYDQWQNAREFCRSVSNPNRTHFTGKIGSCARGYVTCETWCRKWRDSSSSCLYTHPLSCMKHFGSLKACVKDGPPRS